MLGLYVGYFVIQDIYRCVGVECMMVEMKANGCLVEG